MRNDQRTGYVKKPVLAEFKCQTKCWAGPACDSRIRDENEGIPGRQTRAGGPGS